MKKKKKKMAAAFQLLRSNSRVSRVLDLRFMKALLEDKLLHRQFKIALTDFIMVESMLKSLAQTEIKVMISKTQNGHSSLQSNPFSDLRVHLPTVKC